MATATRLISARTFIRWVPRSSSCWPASAPYEGGKYDTPVKKLMALAMTPTPDIREHRPDLPPGLVQVVFGMLAKNPDERFATPDQVAEALEPFCGGCNLQVLLKKSLGEAITEDDLAQVYGGGSSTQAGGSMALAPAGSSISAPPTRFAKVLYFGWRCCGCHAHSGGQVNEADPRKSLEEAAAGGPHRGGDGRRGPCAAAGDRSAVAGRAGQWGRHSGFSAGTKRAGVSGGMARLASRCPAAGDCAIRYGAS